MTIKRVINHHSQQILTLLIFHYEVVLFELECMWMFSGTWFINVVEKNNDFGAYELKPKKSTKTF